ncbi:3-phosphoserine/phosphohydroxythreonine transaminase [Saccharospirillum salsuginis]|uniref:Phosphoserine aminotransferase n=1 Tax=Saccharospirillum salsuginis TaxID=418750 RepID=A0A918KEU5_9GAMM|nr:3-phosphoserine/phosphohydroxythreonine transaminase [Saccharospirillum salsuginis]GGX60769.1 phosphoserine aminotransferase [Saccharospirillum salsuginis]
MTRGYNFCSGPAMLPGAVMQRAQEELPDWQGTGMSVMELSHRSPEFVSVLEGAEARLRTLMNIPEDYAVLFMQGGATLQFSCVPMNLMSRGGAAEFLDTGAWSVKAIKEAGRYGETRVLASTKDEGYRRAVRADEFSVGADAAYLHYTPNETIGGVEFNYVPETGDVPLVADMSSCILSRPINVEDFDLIYAGAQKNIGPAGLTLVIVRKSLLGEVMHDTPSLLNYKAQADNGSMVNTPPTFAIYLAGLVFDWLEGQGGVRAIEGINAEKAALLYDAIDRSEFYRNPIALEHRSRMNVPFILADEQLNDRFLAEAGEAGLYNLQGHRSVGGMRASIYNAMPLAGVRGLVDFMKDFEQRHG